MSITICIIIVNIMITIITSIIIIIITIVSIIIIIKGRSLRWAVSLGQCLLRAGYAGGRKEY